MRSFTALPFCSPNLDETTLENVVRDTVQPVTKGCMYVAKMLHGKKQDTGLKGGQTQFIGVTSNKVWKSVRKKSSGTVFDECCLCKTTCQLQVSSLKISSVFFAIISLFAVGTFSCGSAFNPWLLLRLCFSWTLHQAAAVLKLQATNLVQPERWRQMSGVPKSS